MKFNQYFKYVLAGVFFTLGVLAFLFLFAPRAHAQSGASLWKLSGTTLSPVNSAWTLTVPGMNSTGTTRCVQITSAGLLQVAAAACGSGGGSSTALDLSDNGSDESAGITEIATTGDTNGVFSEPSADKLLINLGLDWPKADIADDLVCTDCIGPTEITDSYVLNTGDTVTGALFVNDIFQVGNSNIGGGEIRLYEDSDNGSNFVSFVAPSTIGSDRTCNLQNLSAFIPDSCVGNGTDDTGGVSFTLAPFATSSGSTELTINKVDIGDDTHVDFTTSFANVTMNFPYRDATGALDTLDDDKFFTDGTNVFLEDAIVFFKTAGAGFSFNFDASALTAPRVYTAPDEAGIVLLKTGTLTPGNCLEAGSDFTAVDSGGACGGSGIPTQITVADTTDATSFVGLFESATGDLGPKTDGGLLYDASNGTLSSTILNTPTLTLTGTGTLNGLDAIDGTGETTLEAALDIAGDVASTGLSSTVIQANAVALTTDTTGNYVASATSNGGLTMTGTEGGSLGVLLPSATDALSSTTSSGSGHELLSSGLTLLQGCSDGQILKWTESTDLWGCAADANSGSATAWDVIGDPSGDGSIAFAGTTQTITGNTNDVTAIGQDLLSLSFTNDAATDILSQRGIFMQNEASANGMEAFIALNNNDADDVVTDGIIMTSLAGAITDALDLSDADIVNAINAGANDLLGTNWSITGSSGLLQIPTLTFTGTGTINGLDAIDATSETTIETAIDTLANLTSIQGFTTTLADAGADAIIGWDDSANAYENLTQAEVLAVVGDSSDTAKGVVELATIAEVNTGTDATRAITPDGLAGSNAAIRYISYTLNATTALTTSEKGYRRIPAGMTGMNLISVTGSVGTGAAGSSSSGTPTFTVKNVTDNNQMLSTSLTIDASEYTSATAATPAVINASFDDVVTDDLIEVAVTTSGTGVTYAVITLGFQLP